MFTSRAEYRLLLSMIMPTQTDGEGHAIGLIDDHMYSHFSEKRTRIQQEIERLRSTRIKPAVINRTLRDLGTSRFLKILPLSSFSSG